MSPASQITAVYLNIAGLLCHSLNPFFFFLFFLLRVERALCHDSILYDCGCNSDTGLGDGVLLQEVSTRRNVVLSDLWRILEVV